MNTRRAALAVATALCATQLEAAGGTLVDGPVTLTYPVTHWSALAPANWLGTEASPTSDLLYTSGFWYRVEGDAREYPMPAPDSEVYNNGRLYAHWANVDGKNFEAIEDLHLFDNEGPSGAFWTRLSLINHGAPRTFTLFYFVDADLAGSFTNDTAQLVPGVSATRAFLRLTDGTDSTSVVRLKVRTPGSPLFHQVAGGSTLRNLLNDSALTHFDGTGLPFAGDFAAGFETSYSVPTNNGLSLSASLTSRLPRDHVKGAYFDLPSYPDLFFHAPTSNLYLSQPMRRTALEPGGLEGYGSAQPLVGVDDLDGDGWDEHLRRDPVSGAVTIEGLPLTGATSPAPNWKLSSTGDFDADAKADILWRNTVSQKLVVWRMDGNAKIGNIVPTPDQAVNANWEVAGTADFNNDGFRDVLWYNQTSGNIVIWYMDAAVVRITGGFTTPSSVGSTAWRVVAVGDYGKGPSGVLNTTDIVWQNDSSHRLVVWNMDFTGTRTSGGFTTPDTLLEGGTVFGPR